MNPKEYSAPSVRQLAAVVGGMADTVSAVRLRQLWMVVGMWDRAVGREEMPARVTRRVDQLFTWPALRGFWDLAVAGELRRFEKTVGTPLPLASQRIVRDCLAILARRAVPGKLVRLPVVDAPELRDTVHGRGLDALYRSLVDLASVGPLERDGTTLTFEDRTRLLAMVAVVLDSGARSGELAALQLTDVTPEEAAVGIRSRQQKAPPNRVEEIAALAGVHPHSVVEFRQGRLYQRSDATWQRVRAAMYELEVLPEVKWYPLREGTRVVLRQWLEVRESLVADLPLTGGWNALWVTLIPSKSGPPGVTIRPQGLTQAYTRGITALNFVMAGRYGWEPMPTRLEQLRRSVDVTPLDEPPL